MFALYKVHFDADQWRTLADGKTLLKRNAEPWVFNEILHKKTKPAKRKAPFRSNMKPLPKGSRYDTGVLVKENMVLVMRHREVTLL